MASKMIKVVGLSSSQGDPIDVPLTQVKSLVTVHDVLEDLKQDSPVALDADNRIPVQVRTIALQGVVDYLALDHQNPIVKDETKIEITYEGLAKEYTLSDWEEKFFLEHGQADGEFNFDKIYKLAEAAMNLHYQRLIDATTTALANNLKGNSKDQMRAKLHLVDDITITPNDERKIKQWGLTYNSPYFMPSDLEKIAELKLTKKSVLGDDYEENQIVKNLTAKNIALIEEYNLTAETNVNDIDLNDLSQADKNDVERFNLHFNSNFTDVIDAIKFALRDGPNERYVFKGKQLTVNADIKKDNNHFIDFMAHVRDLISKLTVIENKKKNLKYIVDSLKEIKKDIRKIKQIIAFLGKTDLNDPDFAEKNDLVRKLIDNENIKRKFGDLVKQ